MAAIDSRELNPLTNNHTNVEIGEEKARTKQSEAHTYPEVA